MGRSSGTFSKRDKEKKRLQKRQEKEQKKEDRKAEGSRSFEEMLAYVDENGNLTSTPPDQSRRKVIKETDINLSSRNKGSVNTPTAREGVIKFFDHAKGYGFVRDMQSQEEFFFHFSSADFEVAQSDAVTFETEVSPRGINAVRISKATAGV